MADNDTSGVQTRWRDLRTGMLFIVGIALVGSLALIISKNTGLFTQLESAYLFVPDIKGLTEGNLVSISGKKVGTIEKMDFIRQNDTQGVLIHMSIRAEFFSLITSDSKAQIKSLGVLGDKYVDISLGKGGALKNGGYLTVAIEPGLDELMGSAQSTLDKVGRLTDEVTSMTEKINRGEGSIGRMITTTELSDRVNITLENADGAMTALRATTARLTDGTGLIPTLINDREIPTRLKGVIASLESFTSDLRSNKGTLGRLVADDALYTDVNRMVRRLDSVVARFGNPDGSLGRLSNDPALYNNLNSSVESLDSLLRDLKLNPGRYVKVSVF
jgi:phospholipid/cholesterol/gamma-HCH transport system substrate-binding protein